MVVSDPTSEPQEKESLLKTFVRDVLYFPCPTRTTERNGPVVTRKGKEEVRQIFYLSVSVIKTYPYIINVDFTISSLGVNIRIKIIRRRNVYCIWLWRINQRKETHRIERYFRKCLSARSLQFLFALGILRCRDLTYQGFDGSVSVTLRMSGYTFLCFGKDLFILKVSFMVFYLKLYNLVSNNDFVVDSKYDIKVSVTNFNKEFETE